MSVLVDGLERLRKIEPGQGQQAGRNGSIERAAPIDRRKIERRHDDTIAVAIAIAIPPFREQRHDLRHRTMFDIEVRFDRRILDLDVHKRAAQHIERLFQGWNMTRTALELSESMRDDRRCPAVLTKSGDNRIVMDHQDVVSRASNVEFHPVGADLQRTGKCCQRVLSPLGRRAAVSKNQWNYRHRWMLIPRESSATTTDTS